MFQKLATLILASFLFMPWPGAPTPPVDLDPSFGGSGVVTTSYGGVNAQFLTVNLLPDGKILAAGGSFDPPNWDFALARYLPDGRLDPIFGQDGKVVTKFGNMASINAVAIQSDGKIVAAGTVWVGTSHTAFALARYDPSGSLDPAFGDHGLATTIFEGISGIQKLLVQPDGAFLAAGFAYTATGRSDIALARYRADGSLDETFGDQGKVTANFGFQDSTIDASLLPDGEILIAGLANSEQKYVNGFQFLALYQTDGALDKSCGTDGLKNLSNYPLRIWAIALQLDGKLMLAGSGDRVAELMRLRALPGNCLIADPVKYMLIMDKLDN